MTQTPPIITFRVAISSKASGKAVYDVLSDPNTHLVWAGKQAPRKDFRLLTMEAPSGSATVGTEFSSSGASSRNGEPAFFDHSIVVEADRGARFGFDTDSTLKRPRA